MKWKHSKHYNKTHPERWADKKRKWLIEKLGGKRVLCDSTYLLEFDHLKPRTWQTRDMNRARRMKLYIEEAAKGLIQLLCKKCNGAKGQPLPDEPMEPAPI